MGFFDFLPWRRKASSEQVGTATIGVNQYRAPSVQTKDLLGRYHQWVYTCSTKNANSVAQSQLRLYAVTRQGERAVRAPHRAVDVKSVRRKSVIDRGYVVEVVNHPFLDLLQYVNDRDDNYETMELTELHMELCGNAYWYVSYGDLGTPNGIIVLRPDLIKIVPNEDGSIKGYLYGRKPNQIALYPEEVVHYKFPNPLDQYYGMSPLQAVIASDEQYQRTLEYETALAQNNAVPTLGIQYDGVIPGDEIKKVEADWNRALRGQNKTGRIKVYDNRFEVKQFQLKPAELNFLEGRKWTREEIAGAYGVPLSLLTTGDVNLANAKVGERTYARWTVLPRLCRIEDRLNTFLQTAYNEPRIFVAYDNPVPEDDEFELKRTIELSGSAIITRDEARQMQGLDPVGGEEGDAYLPKTSTGNVTAPTEGKSVKDFTSLKTFSEHQFVLRAAANFDAFRKVLNDFGRGIHTIYGITADDRTHLFAILFDSTIWTFEAAKLWVREHNYQALSRAPATDPLAR